MLKEDGETLELAAADPTQENEGLITIELSTAASAVIESHERITIHSLQPVIRLSLRAAGAKGQSCSIRFVKLAEQ
jgi:hypothetical protein